MNRSTQARRYLAIIEAMLDPASGGKFARFSVAGAEGGILFSISLLIRSRKRGRLAVTVMHVLIVTRALGGAMSVRYLARQIGQRLIDPQKLGLYQRPEFCEVDARPVSLEKGATAFDLQFLNCLRQRGLGNAAATSCTGETPLFAECEEVSDLVQVHAHVRPTEPQFLLRANAMAT